MKQLYIVICVLVCSTAQAYIPFISEDRIWEYFYDNGNTYGDQANELSKFKFDGTQELNGKTYHQLKYISLSHWKIEDGKLILSGEYDKPVNSIIALLREEDGVVYWNREIQKENSDNPEYEEVILYDFRHEPGEEFRAIGSDYLNSESWYDIKYNEVPYLTVAADRCENWDGKHFIFRNLQSVEFTKQYDYLRWEERFGENFADVEIVEGLGNVGLGSIIHPDHIARMEYNSENPITLLNNVYDLEGNIIYKGYNTDNPYLTTASENRTLRKDRVWRYHENTCEISVKWVSDTIVDNKEYMKFRADYNEYGSSEIFRTDYMLLIEEDNRIYNYSDLKRFASDPLKAILLHDFNLKEGDQYESVVWCPIDDRYGTFNSTISISKILNLDINQNSYLCQIVKCKDYSFPDDILRIIEGIGPLDAGFIGRLFWGPAITRYPRSTNFYQLEDLDGNVLITHDEVDKAIAKANGVETVGADTEEGDGRMFDLMGRELRCKPARGTLYIQNGRKHISR